MVSFALLPFPKTPLKPILLLPNSQKLILLLKP
ncbi:MAG: hypothetical protein ACJA0Q_000593, partial [Saprospiraceae bacterium]